MCHLGFCGDAAFEAENDIKFVFFLQKSEFLTKYAMSMRWGGLAVRTEKRSRR